MLPAVRYLVFSLHNILLTWQWMHYFFLFHFSCSHPFLSLRLFSNIFQNERCYDSIKLYKCVHSHCVATANDGHVYIYWIVLIDYIDCHLFLFFFFCNYPIIVSPDWLSANRVTLILDSGLLLLLYALSFCINVLVLAKHWTYV